MLDGMFYGTLRIPDQWGRVFAIDETELADMIEQRLPLLKDKNYKVRF